MNKFIRKVMNVIFSAASREARRHSMVGEGRLWKMKRDFQIDFLVREGLRPEHYLLDIGCGTLRGGIPVIAYLEKGHYYGIDVREDVLREARKEVQDHRLSGKEPILSMVSDMASLRMDRSFDYLWAFSVLIHMQDALLDACLDMVSRHLIDNGVFYANVNLGKAQEGSWQGFPVVHRSAEFYAAMCLKNGLSVSDAGTLRSLGHVTSIKHQDEQHMLKIVRSKA